MKWLITITILVALNFACFCFIEIESAEMDNEVRALGITHVEATTGGYNLPNFQCPANTFVTGAKWGHFVCSPLPVAKKLAPRGYGQ